MSMNPSRRRRAAAWLCTSSLGAAVLVGCGGGGSSGGAADAAPAGTASDNTAAALAAAAVNSTPITTCDNAGIGSAHLTSDLPTLPTTNPANDSSATITSVSTGTTSTGVPYCLVKVLVPPAINIWVGLPTGGQWNGRLQSED